MAVPGLIAWGSDAVMRLAFNNSKRAAAAPAVAGGAAALAGTAAAPVPIAPFLNLSYGYLPLVWGATLSHYLRQFLEEAGNILPVTAATFGLDGSSLPSVTADHAVTEFLQGSTLLAGAFFSLLATRKVGARPWLVLAPQCLTILGFTAELWYLVVR
eukprot:GHUV01012706.1.p2 GENE.GHUV01012706.1~~GHUV01012706.1.p2  ORF type:complete len:157 (+),score=59.99 GHUV01012706.1:1176-1646(+)